MTVWRILTITAFFSTVLPGEVIGEYSIDNRYFFNEATQGQDKSHTSFTLSPELFIDCLLYTSPSPRDLSTSRMPSSA